MDKQSIDHLSFFERETRLRREAGTRGGEYSGPCALCKAGRDRFHVQPLVYRWKCRVCHPTWDDIITYVMVRDSVEFIQAKKTLGLDTTTSCQATEPATPLPPRNVVPPSDTWQKAARAFLESLDGNLQSSDYPRALHWLDQRGVSAEVALQHCLRYNPEDRKEPAALWGFEEEGEVYLPRGIVIPWWIDGQIWRINVRRPIAAGSTAKRYMQVKGGRNGLYRADTLTAGCPTLIVEGELDALAVVSSAPELLIPVATGSTCWAQELRWASMLVQSSTVLLAFDNDGPEKGEQAAGYWLNVLGASAQRWRPYLKDCGEMATSGLNIREWIEAGLII